MTSSRRLLPLLSVLMLPLLAGCGIFGKQVSLEFTDEDKQRCPPVGIVAYTGEITRFVPGPGRTTNDVVNRGTISGLTVSCFDTPTGVDATLSFDISASVADARPSTFVDLTYFVAVTNDVDQPLERKHYNITVPIADKHGSVHQYIGLQVSVGLDGRLEDKEVLIGFELTKEQLTYNIHR
jgi:hypothetical protein